MSDFIPRQHALNVLSEVAIDNFSLSDSFEVYLKALNDASERIKKIPSARSEQKRGKWITIKYPFSKCSICNCDFDTANNEANYCPVCGAAMDMERE
jgi:hypothetical protein